jgi:hypothetical protein
VLRASVAARLAAIQGGALPPPLPLFPRDNWWNLDISTAPVDPGSAAFISFVGATRGMHPAFGGDVSTGSVQNYGFPYAVVDGTLTKRAVQFQYADESDGVDHTTGASFPVYPIPDEAITQPHWIESGEPGNVDLRSSSDRHLLIVDRDNRRLYELYNRWGNGVLNPAFSAPTGFRSRSTERTVLRPRIFGDCGCALGTKDSWTDQEPRAKYIGTTSGLVSFFPVPGATASSAACSRRPCRTPSRRDSARTPALRRPAPSQWTRRGVPPRRRDTCRAAAA